MYNVVNNVLNKGGYDLTEMLKKLDSLWVEGKLTDAEYKELTQRAKGGARLENSVDILAKLEELDRRLTAVENKEASEPETGSEEYPAFVEGKWYYNGDKCSFEGVNYVCTAPEEAVCVWSPKAYPEYWAAM